MSEDLQIGPPFVEQPRRGFLVPFKHRVSALFRRVRHLKIVLEISQKYSNFFDLEEHFTFE